MFLVLLCSNLVEKSDFQKFNSCVTDGGTDRPIDGPTEGRTYPLIEMRERIKNLLQTDGQRNGQMNGQHLFFIIELK